jgi:hypothetical protein
MSQAQVPSIPRGVSLARPRLQYEYTLGLISYSALNPDYVGLKEEYVK